MNKKQVIRLNENQLRQIVTESVKKVLNEIGDTESGQYMLGRLAGRKWNKADIKGFQDVARYAERQRINKNGDEGDNSLVIDNPLRYNYNRGHKDYNLYTNPNHEWGDGYEDEDGNVNYILKNGSAENEREKAKEWIDYLKK